MNTPSCNGMAQTESNPIDRAGCEASHVLGRGLAPFSLIGWNTRQESNLRALGSKPNGDAGNPRLVYGSGGRNRTCVGCVQSAAGMPATHT